MKEKFNKNGNIIVTLIVAIASVTLGSLTTYFIMRGKTANVSNNLKGTKWFNAYAGELITWDFGKDGKFNYTYIDQSISGTYTYTDEVITAKADGYSDEKLIYSIEDGKLVMSNQVFYKTEKEAKENDEYMYIPEDYDTSMFKSLTAEQLIEKFNKGDSFFVLWARGSCGYCQKFRPIAAESLKKYNYDLYYVNVASLTNEDYEKISALDEQLATNVSSTPNIFYISKNKVKDFLGGYAEADELGTFLKDNGVKEK